MDDNPFHDLAESLQRLINRSRVLRDGAKRLGAELEKFNDGVNKVLGHGDSTSARTAQKDLTDAALNGEESAESRADQTLQKESRVRKIERGFSSRLEGR